MSMERVYHILIAGVSPIILSLMLWIGVTVNSNQVFLTKQQILTLELQKSIQELGLENKKSLDYTYALEQRVARLNERVAVLEHKMEIN